MTVNPEHIDRIADLWACIYDEDARKEIRDSIQSVDTKLSGRDQRGKNPGSLKVCSECARSLPRDEAHFHREERRNGYKPRCKWCVNGWAIQA